MAPGEAPWMYAGIPDDVRDVIDFIGPCRDSKCLVPKAHPYYHNEILDPDSQTEVSNVKNPLMPVVPSVLNTGRIFILGDYPTAKFTARSAGNQPVSLEPGADNHFFVPIGDIWAPMQDASYFDGYKIRFVASGTFFVHNYLMSPVLKDAGVPINPATQVWTTNLIKCYLFHTRNVQDYKAMGWYDVKVEATHEQILPIADVCWRRNLVKELDVCDPMLIITVGQPNCTVVQNLASASPDEQKDAYDALQGVPLRANEVSPLETDYPRQDPWIKYNVIHMIHPEAILISQTDASSSDPEKAADAKATLKKHEENLQKLADFLDELGWKDILAADQAGPN